MNTDTLRRTLLAVFHLVRKNFVEKADVGESWVMPPSGYDGTQLLRDDCDGFCLACRHLLRKLDIPSRLVYCEVDGGGHLVVEVQGWILDNRQNTVVPNTLLRHYKWLRISGFNPGEPWQQVLGMDAAATR